MKRKKIRKISFFISVIAILSIFSAVNIKKANDYKKQISIWEQSSLCSLSTYIDTIKTDLYKGMYASTPLMTGKISASLLQSSSAALECLQRLPSGEKGLSNICKFLTQVGSFTDSLNKKTALNRQITDEEYENMQSLFKYASDLSTQIDYMQEVMLSGNVNFENDISTLSFKKETNDLSLSYTDTISSAEDSFTDFPTLIYDGPFSDDIQSKESQLLSKKEEISQNLAKRKCAEYLSLKSDESIFKYEEASQCEAYVFSLVNSSRQTTVAITKKGGFLSYILSEAYSAEKKYSEEEAIEAGFKFLEKCGYTDMINTYYSVEDGICTVNYAYKADDYICYPDLIKVSISLSDCTVTSFDARTYLMNHTDRSITEPSLTVNEAMNKISKKLTVNSVRKAVIPTDNYEKTAYEFNCTGSDGDDVLVYIDTTTGQEDEILILLHSDGGILTK